MAKKKTDIDSLAVSIEAPTVQTAVSHIKQAVALLREMGAEVPDYVAGRLEHWVDQLEKFNNE